MVKMDPTFYHHAAEAMAAPKEELAYVVGFDPEGKRNEAVFVVDVNSQSKKYGRVVGKVDIPAGQASDFGHHLIQPQSFADVYFQLCRNFITSDGMPGKSPKCSIFSSKDMTPDYGI